MQVSLAPYCLLIGYASLVIEVEGWRSKGGGSPEHVFDWLDLDRMWSIPYSGRFFRGAKFQQNHTISCITEG